ncbi:TSCPD domain-containing protein [Geobacter sp. FeAm09]|uniref:TSCPD domain-containing protein n=1 Tax=Geobacter sp. FeAm09 TaxID=2597769 RepID=UPI0011F00308|nr:TSCPD domain-containing protein [Geobacter sp. FeAm09]QEM66726.1 TSCPD domain-containing protein [Geobacter sp. FeAm09]
MATLQPKALPGTTYEMPTACGPIYVTILRDADTGRLHGLKLRFGKSGGCGAAFADGMASVVSSALQAGMEPSLISRDLGGINCHLGNNTCMHAVACAFAEELGIPPEDNSPSGVPIIEDSYYGE